MPPQRALNQIFMLQKIDHIGIAVKDLEASIPLYERLLGIKCFKIEEVATEKVRTAFFQLESLKIELIATTDEFGPVAKFLDKRGEGLHHIAFAVNDIESASARLIADQFSMINEQPKPGADNKLINFIQPAQSGRVLIELCADIPNPLADRK